MSVWLQELSFAWRRLRRQAVGASLVVGMLALGLSSSIVVISVVDATILRPVPYPDPEQLVGIVVAVRQASGESAEVDPSELDRSTWRAHASSFAQLAASQRVRGVLVGDTELKRRPAMRVDGSYFAMYGTVPVVGRAIADEDTVVGASGVVMISFEYWRQEFGKDETVTGRVLRFGDATATIVGVAPAGFFPDIDLWLPVMAGEQSSAMRGTGVSLHGRLKPDASPTAAAAELTSLSGDGAVGDVVLVKRLVDDIPEVSRTTVVLLGGGVVLIVLIACINIVFLLLVRGLARQGELSVRAALGASPRRLLSQLLAEHLLLCAIGVVAGFAIAGLALDFTVRNLPLALPPNVRVGMDATVLAYATLLAAVVSLLCAYPPALRLARSSATAALLRDGRQTALFLKQRSRQMIIATEVALAVLLLVGTGLMIRSYERLRAVDMGFDPSAFLIVDVAPVDLRGAEYELYYSTLIDRIGALPGVSAVGAADQVPLLGRSVSANVRRPGNPQVSVNVRQIVPGYLEALGLPVVGRDLLPGDRSGSTVSAALINREAGRRLFGETDPLGQPVVFLGERVDIVGVVDDVRHTGPMLNAVPEVYLPFRPPGSGPLPDLGLAVIVRRSGKTAIAEQDLRRILGESGQRVLVNRIGPATNWYAEVLNDQRQRMVLLSLLGGLATILAIGGVVSVTSYTAARRTREVALRLALGARSEQVIRSVVRDTMIPTLIGTACALATAPLAASAIRGLLYGTSIVEPMTFVSVAFGVCGSACLAAYTIGLRLSRTDPAELLRRQ
jgi:predicted permease